MDEVSGAPTAADLDAMFDGERYVPTREELAELDLPAELLAVVVELGAPTQCGVYFQAGPWRRKRVHLPSTGADLTLWRFGSGWHDTTDFFVEPAHQHIVGLVFEGDKVIDESYVNRDYATFIEYLYWAWHLIRLEESDPDRGELLAAVHRVRERYAVLDPAALQEGAWWAGLVEEFDMI